MRRSLKEFIADSTEDQLSESIVGKGFAIGQQRKHASNVTKLQSVISRIHSTAQRGISEDDQHKREAIIFSLFGELGNALKIIAEMSKNSINVSTIGVLDTESVRNELRRISRNQLKR